MVPNTKRAKNKTYFSIKVTKKLKERGISILSSIKPPIKLRFIAFSILDSICMIYFKFYIHHWRATFHQCNVILMTSHFQLQLKMKYIYRPILYSLYSNFSITFIFIWIESSEFWNSITKSIEFNFIQFFYELRYLIFFFFW